jgi:hypothetical protein
MTPTIIIKLILAFIGYCVAFWFIADVFSYKLIWAYVFWQIAERLMEIK